MGERPSGATRRLAVVVAADMAGYSRLMELGEDDILRRQKTHRQELIAPAIEAAGGEVVKSTGDGLLASFVNATDAVRASIEIQAAMAQREAETVEQRRILYRFGINLGEVVFEDGDIFGDAVNVAARLQTLAKPGGICIADSVRQLVVDRLDARFHDLGLQRVKTISRQLRVWQWLPDPPEQPPAASALQKSQQIRFCTSRDGTQIAYARIGKGAAVLKAPNWLNHLEYEWRSPSWGPVWRRFAEGFELVRFDQRGNGLSDWEVETICEDAMIEDMAAVADAAALQRFGLFGISQGCAFSIRYAALHPERVSCLVLLGGYLRGRLRRDDPTEAQLYEMATTMIRQGWGSPHKAYRRFFTDTLMPDATPDQAADLDELQRICITPENALRIWQMNAMVEVSQLARRLRLPTLVLHCRDDRMVPLREERRLAASIPGARFVELEGANHALVEGTPAFEQFFEEALPFLQAHTGG